MVFDILSFFLVDINILDIICRILKSNANYELSSMSLCCAVDSYRKASAPKYNRNGIDGVHFLKKMVTYKIKYY